MEDGGLSLETVLAQAERKLGSRKAVLAAIDVSRQRFHSALSGGPPMHIERLLRLALVAGTDPLETLRAGGRARFADLLEEAARPRLGETTMTQRALLREFERLSQPAQALIMELVGGLVAEREAFARRIGTRVADTELRQRADLPPPDEPSSAWR